MIDKAAEYITATITVITIYLVDMISFNNSFILIMPDNPDVWLFYLAATKDIGMILLIITSFLGMLGISFKFIFKKRSKKFREASKILDEIDQKDEMSS